MELAKFSIQELELHIQYLMDQNFEGLVQLLYSIDVEESRIKELELIDATTLSQLIYERLKKREEEKAFWSKRFSSE